MFSDRFTVFPDTGTTELHCYVCNRSWPIGYHPSLDVLIEQAREHNRIEHGETS